MNLILNIVIGAIVAYIVLLLLEWLGIPAPIPVVAGLLTFLVVAFGGSRWGGHPFRS
jgi:hypothetical protein